MSRKPSRIEAAAGALPQARDERGLSVVEILIATVLVAIVAVGVAVMFSTGQAFINNEGDNRAALYLAQQRLEQLRVQGGALTPAVCADMCTDPPLTLTVGSVPKVFTRTWTVKCLLPTNYDATPEGCFVAQYPSMAKLIIVCVVEGSFTAACNPPIAPSTGPGLPSGAGAFPADVRASQQRVVVLRSVLAPRF